MKPRSLTPLCFTPRSSRRSTACMNVAWDSAKARWCTQPGSVGVRCGSAVRSSLVKIVISRPSPGSKYRWLSDGLSRLGCSKTKGMPSTPTQKSIEVWRSAPTSVMWWTPWLWSLRGMVPAKLRHRGRLLASEVGHRRLAVDDLAPDAEPVVGRVELPEDAEHEAVRAQRHDLVGRQLHLAEALAHVAVLEHEPQRGVGRQADVLVAHEPPRRRLVLLHQRLDELAAALDHALAVGDVVELVGVALVDRAQHLELHLALVDRLALEEPEVEERDAPVVHEQRVARVRVAVEQAVAVRAVDVEAEEDLAPARALLVGVVEDLREAPAVDEVGDDHALRAQLGDDLGHEDERVVAVLAGQRAVVGRLELVVELLGDALAQLVGDLAAVEAGGQPREQLEHHPHVLHVGADDVLDARVLDLDRDVAPAVLERPAVDLPDRRGGDRLLVELGEDRAELAAEVGLDDLAHVLEGDLRGHVLQLGELGLELLAVWLGDRADVDDRQRLA